MKKIFKRMLAIIMVVFVLLTSVPLQGLVGLNLPDLFSISAKASENEGDFDYNVIDGKAELINYCGVDTNVTIPDTLGGYEVVSIGEKAFWYRSDIESIVIPDGIKSIGERAFIYCTKLENITIPDSVTTIGDWAFYDCIGLTSITIPDSVTTIGDWAFYDTGYYNNSSNWENGFLYLGNHLIKVSDTFSGECNIKPGTITIAEGAVEDCCNDLTVINIPESVVNIGSGAFFGSCTYISVDKDNKNFINDENGILFNKDKTVLVRFPSLNENLPNYEIPDGITEIGGGAFSCCYYLTEIIIPDSVRSIGDLAFYSSYEITDIKLPDGITEIGEGAFALTSVEKIVLPSSLTRISESLFDNCHKLTEVIIPYGVTSIGESAFISDSLTSVTIPGSVTSIETFAFFTPNLVSIEISDDVTGIQNGAFGAAAYCSDDNNWENGALYIGKHLIEYDADATEYTIKEGTKSIAGGAFWGNKLNKVTIPASVSYIGEDSFENCSALVDIYYDGTQAQWNAIQGNPFLETDVTVHYKNCEHSNAENRPEQTGSCKEVGYTEGVYCPDCAQWVSGHEEIPAEHKDADGNLFCDFCQLYSESTETTDTFYNLKATIDVLDAVERDSSRAVLQVKYRALNGTDKIIDDWYELDITSLCISKSEGVLVEINLPGFPVEIRVGAFVESRIFFYDSVEVSLEKVSINDKVIAEDLGCSASSKNNSWVYSSVYSVPSFKLPYICKVVSDKINIAVSNINDMTKKTTALKFYDQYGVRFQNLIDVELVVSNDKVGIDTAGITDDKIYADYSAQGNIIKADVYANKNAITSEPSSNYYLAVPAKTVELIENPVYVEIIISDESYSINYDIDSGKLVNDVIDNNLVNSDFDEFYKNILGDSFSGEQVSYGQWQYDYAYKNADGTTTVVKKGDVIKNYRELLISSVINFLWNGSLQTDLFRNINEAFGESMYNSEGYFDVLIELKDSYQWLPEITYNAIASMPHHYSDTSDSEWYKFFNGDIFKDFGYDNLEEYDYTMLLDLLSTAPIDAKLGSGASARSYWDGFTYADGITNEESSVYKPGDVISDAQAIDEAYWNGEKPIRVTDGKEIFFDDKSAWHIDDWSDFYRTLAVATCGYALPIVELLIGNQKNSDVFWKTESDVLGLDATVKFEMESYQDIYNSFFVPLYKALGIEKYDAVNNPLGYRKIVDILYACGTYADSYTVPVVQDGGILIWEYVLEPIIGWMENQLFVNPTKAILNAIPGIVSLLCDFDIQDNFNLNSSINITMMGIPVSICNFGESTFENIVIEILSAFGIETNNNSEDTSEKNFLNCIFGAKRTQVAPSDDNISSYIHIDNDETKDVYRDEFGYYYTNVGCIGKKIFESIGKAYFDWLSWKENIGSLSFKLPFEHLSGVYESEVADYEELYVYAIDELLYWIYDEDGFGKIKPLLTERKEILSANSSLTDKDSLEQKCIDLLLSFTNYAALVSYTDKFMLNSDKEHIWDEGKVVYEANCSVGGIKLYTCTDCGATKREAIEKLPHDNHLWRNIKADCVNDGRSEYICSVCEATTIVPNGEKATGHSYKDEIVEPTCKDKGYTKHICEICNDEYVDTYVPVSDHKYSQEHFDATSDKDSYTLYTCIYCGENYEVIDPAVKVDNFIVLGDTHSVKLSWSKAVELFATGYRIYRKSQNENDFKLLVEIDSRDTLSYSDNDVTAGEEYSYMIQVMKDDVEGEMSDVVTVVPNYDRKAPVIAAFTPSHHSKINGTVTVKGIASDNFSKIKYVLSYSLKDNNEKTVLYTSEYMASGTEFSYSLNSENFADGTYVFYLTAVDEDANESDILSRTWSIDNTAPDRVSGLTAVAVYSSKITLSWDKPEAKDTSHFVLEKYDGEKFVVIASDINDCLGYNLDDLVPETDYTFRVLAVDALGNRGDYSEEYTVSTLKDESTPVVTKLTPEPGRYNASIKFVSTVEDDCKVKLITVQKSVDANTWTDIHTEIFASPASEKSFTYTVDLTNEAEGYLYLRVIAEDTSGNISDDSKDAPLVQYVVDRTPPAAPANVVATGKDGYISIEWLQGSETDLGKYYVYRSTTEDGTYSPIASSLSTLNYHDRNIDRGTTYYYKVRVNDRAGNYSDYSNVIYAASLEDTEKPEINSISPLNGASVGINSSTVKVLASDNNMLSNIVLEYKTGLLDEYKELKNFTGINNYYKTVNATLPIDELSDGDIVYLRAYCTDVTGLVSEYSSTVKYYVDKIAPELKDFVCTTGASGCTLNWNDCGEDDLAGFKVYRSVNGGNYKLIGSRAVSDSSAYNFVDSVTAGEYVYRIDSVDKVGNLRSYYSEKQTIIAPVKLEAVISVDAYIEKSVQYVFKASDSIADETIVSYEWDFGDGTTSDKENPVKSYSETGTYKIKLTITDILGNVAETERTITVSERELFGVVKVKVVNENGYAISNAPVYFDLGEENQQIVYTNTSGYASLTMTVGTHIVGSYKNGSLPVSGNITVLANATAEITLTMVEQELITGEFEVHEMTFEEIKAAGIDVNDPANQQIYEVEVTLIYGEEKIPVTYVRNDTEIISYTIGNTGGGGGGGGSHGGGGGSHGGSKINYISFVPNEMNQEIIAVVEIPITASYLKQFYSANLHIVNNAAAGYEIVNCEASISVPDGLTVVQHTPISSVIDGQQSSSANWILRGDEAGSYNLSADFSGVLDSFNVPVSASFTADEPVVVYGPDSVKLRIEVEEELNKDLHFNLCLVNKRDVNVNCPQINAPDFVFNITERYKKIIKNENPDGIKDKVALCEFLRVGKVSADGKAEFFDVNDDSQVPIDYLAPGESLVYEYVLKHVTNGQGGTGYFQKAIVDCDEFYKSSIEVVCMSEMPLGITEDQFIKEHLEFIASSEYRSADLEFPARVSEALKEEWEDDWYQFIELDYSTNYAEVVLADYMLQKSTYDDMETKYGEYLLTETTDLYASLTRVVKEEFFTDYDDLTEEKIMNIFTGFDYESSEYKHMNDVFKKAPEDSLKNLYKTYYGFDLAMNVWEFGCDTVDSIKKTGKYIAAIIAYRNCMDTYFKEVLSNASAHLGEDEKKMKEAIENFTGSENTAKFAEVLFEEINQTAGAIGFSALKIVFMETFVDLVTISATAAIKTIAAKAGIQIGSAAYAELMSIVGGIAIGVTLGMSVSKVLANTENLNYTASMMEYYSQLAESLRKELKIREADFLSEPISFEEALYFDSSYKAFKSAWLATAELFLNFAKGKNNSLAVKLFDRDKFSDYINDSTARISSIKQLNCHASNHYVNTTSSKILMVECPVDVTIYDAKGNVLAIVTNDSAEIIDNRIVATNWESKKFIALPTDEDFNIRITANDSGKMDYTVLEYLSDINIRRVVFEDIALEKNDVFEGNVDSVLFTDKDNYALTKNDNDVITATEDIEHKLTGITLDKETVMVQCGESIELNATVEPVDAENAEITWSSYDETIASVSESGIVLASKPGEVIVKAVTEDGGYVAYCTVTVKCTEHKYGQWSITEQPSCKTEGKQARVCEYCEYVDEQILDKLKHTGGVATCKVQKICSLCNEPYGNIDEANHINVEVTAQQDATCEEIGYTAGRYCVDCNTWIEGHEEIGILKHNFNEWYYTTKPTCTSAGEEKRICSHCDYFETRTVSKLQHVYSDTFTVDKEASCTVDGSKSRHCASCDAKTDVTVVRATGHKYTETIVYSATCTNEGLVVFKCFCENSYTEVVPAVAHKDSDGNDYCDYCDKNLGADKNCSHMCHKSGFMGFIWKIINLFNKLFKSNKTCACGVVHY